MVGGLVPPPRVHPSLAQPHSPPLTRSCSEPSPPGLKSLPGWTSEGLGAAALGSALIGLPEPPSSSSPQLRGPSGGLALCSFPSLTRLLPAREGRVEHLLSEGTHFLAAEILHSRSCQVPGLCAPGPGSWTAGLDTCLSPAFPSSFSAALPPFSFLLFSSAISY